MIAGKVVGDDPMTTRPCKPLTGDWLKSLLM